MITKQFCCGVLIVILSVVLVRPAEASGYPNAGAIVGGIAAVAAVVVIVAVVIIHKSTTKRTITGCVNADENGMSVTDEKDKQSYALAGQITGIKAGDRMTLQGKKMKTRGAAKPLTWETKRVTKDFGICQQ